MVFLVPWTHLRQDFFHFIKARFIDHNGLTVLFEERIWFHIATIVLDGRCANTAQIALP